jgi:hypothetical protein
MLIIAIGYGGWNPAISNETDPFSCSTDTEVVFEDPKDALAFICGAEQLEEERVDEILIIKNDEVVKHFFSEHWS